MAIDPVTSLAFAVQSQPGVYAFLIGSGVSRAAEIPTGWGVVTQLLIELAAATGDEISGKPEDWYRERYGEPVGFSSLLHRLAPTRSERRALMARFIEPDPDHPDRRVPTAAHRAAARLARSGHVKVFVTTNFDRLLEQALTEAGLAPLVIATPAEARGAAPFHHSEVVVFKLHGDYMDPDSMLVTEDELATYDPDVAERLARTLEDYGLVVIGWSAEWDPALREAISAPRSRRYPLYLAARGNASDVALQLVDARQGVVVAIDDAETFVPEIVRRVEAIERVAERHPLDTAALVASVKRALPRPELRIELDDVVGGEAKRVRDRLSDENEFPAFSAEFSDSPAGWRWYLDRAAALRALVDPLAHVFATAAAWDDEPRPTWRRALEAIAVFDEPMGQWNEQLVALRRLPALYVLYAVGVVSVVREHYALLHSLTVEATYFDRRNRLRWPMLGAVSPWYVAPGEPAGFLLYDDVKADERLSLEQLAERRAHPTRWLSPVSLMLHATVRGAAGEVIVDNGAYDDAFDDLEVLLSALSIDVADHLAEGWYAPGPWYGRFTSSRSMTSPREAAMAERAVAEGADWAPVRAGMFAGSPARVAQAFDKLLDEAKNVRRSRM